MAEIADFAGAVAREKDREKLSKAAAVLAESSGKDHVTVVATAIPRGVRYRLQLEEGALNLIAHGVRNRGR